MSRLRQKFVQIQLSANWMCKGEGEAISLASGGHDRNSVPGVTLANTAGPCTQLA